MLLLRANVSNIQEVYRVFSGCPCTVLRIWNKRILFPKEHSDRLKVDEATLIRDVRFEEDCRVVVVNFNNVLFSVGEPIPETPGTCKVKVIEFKRNDPQRKTTDWAEERTRLQDPSIYETIMSHDQRLCEGLSSSFLAINHQGQIMTAPEEEVLRGTMIQEVLNIFKCKGFHIRREAPLLEQIRNAFICSTSRLIIPVEEIQMDGKIYPLEVYPETEQLRKDLSDRLTKD